MTIQIDQRVLEGAINKLRSTELELEAELLAGVTHTASITGRFESVSHQQVHGALSDVRSAIAQLEAARTTALSESPVETAIG